jgi:hypothetical protein
MKHVDVTTSKRDAGEWPEGPYVSRSSGHVLAYNSKRFGIGYSEAFTWKNNGSEMPASRTFIREPHGWSYGLPVVLAADVRMGSGAQSERMRKTGMESVVEDGDLVIFDGDQMFKVGPLTEGKRVRREYLALTYVGTVGQALAMLASSRPA